MTLPTIVVMAAVGCAFYLLLLNRAARFGEIPQMLLTFGLSIGAQGLAQVLEWRWKSGCPRHWPWLD